MPIDRFLSPCASATTWALVTIISGVTAKPVPCEIG